MVLVRIVYGVFSLVIALRQVYWWQVKEYRWDRWWSWVRYNEGFWDIIKIDLRKPKITFRSLIICLFGMVAAVLGGWLGPILAFMGVIIGVFVTYPLMEWQREKIMTRAAQKMKTSKARVITVNGSYGKSSSKDFLVQILSNKFNVVGTKGSENTELGVARRILSDLDKNTQIVVLEMGAYKRGEISRMTKMAQPSIAWVTGMGPQHIDLFGGMDNSRRAEFETIEALSSGGVAIFNGDSPEEQPMVNWAKKLPINVEVYSLGSSLGKVTTEGFELKIDKENVWVPIRGAHFAQNVLGAVTVAKIMGMNKEEIIKALRKLQQPEKSMIRKQLSGGTVVLDNSYNSNREGFLASIAYLKLYPGRKFLLTPGIIELGKMTAEVHRELGKELVGLHRVWVSRKGVEKWFIESGVKVVLETNQKKLAEQILKELKNGDVLLIEGRISPILKSEIMKI